MMAVMIATTTTAAVDYDCALFAIASSKIETLDEVVNRLKQALSHIDRERLIVAPDCGLGLLPPNLAEEKLKIMCQAAAIV